MVAGKLVLGFSFRKLMYLEDERLTFVGRSRQLINLVTLKRIDVGLLLVGVYPIPLAGRWRPQRR
jgi:hypothetical protein